MSGAACAAALSAAGAQVTVLERGRAPGGRMASPELAGRRVDIGASYFTCSDAGFSDLVQRWRAAGLARLWTDRFAVYSAAAAPTVTPAGSDRWSAPQGLRSLMRDLFAGQEVRTGVEVTDLQIGAAGVAVAGIEADAVVLAMPDPQAQRILARSSIEAPSEQVGYEPVLAITASWLDRCWPFQDGAFVNEHPVLSFVADDGARRGDGAPVLVVHTTSEFAAAHLQEPGTAAAPVMAALQEVFGLPPGEVIDVHRWAMAKPAGTHDAPYFWDSVLGLAGDSWCPEGSPRVESAWLSGTRLAQQVLASVGR